MLAVARGCLELLIVWAIAGGGLFLFYDTRFTAPGPLWSGLIGGFALAAAWGLARNGILARKQAALIQRSFAGAMPSPDQPYAAVGKAVVVGQPLNTPFLDQPCVLYAYELVENKAANAGSSKGARTETQRIVYLSGMAMTNWAVDTKVGRIRVCGFPVPDQFEEVEVDKQACFQQIRDFCQSTTFTHVGRWDLGKMLNFAGVVLQQSAETVREDLWFDEADGILEDRGRLQRCRLTEQAISVGQSVCVLGKYDAHYQGLTNDLGAGGLQVIPGNASHAMRQMRQSAAFYLVVAVVAALLGTLGSYGILTLRERSLVAIKPVADLSQACPIPALRGSILGRDDPSQTDSLELACQLSHRHLRAILQIDA